MKAVFEKAVQVGQWGRALPQGVAQGIAVAWQIAFFVLAQDPVRYRSMMIPAIIEKATFAIAVSVLFAFNRVSLPMLGAGLVDAILAVLFAVAFIRTRRLLLIDSGGPKK